MIRKLFFGAVLTAAGIVLIHACQPKAGTRVAPEASVDSTLYFAAEPVPDPFRDSLAVAGPPVRLSHTVYPPPPEVEPLPRFKQIEGFRIQVFAGVDSSGADLIRTQLQQQQLSDTVYMIEDKGLYKVQIGDYPYRAPADQLIPELRREGYPGAWVVQRRINIPRTDADNAVPDSAAPATPVDSVRQGEGTYRIQVLATSSDIRARQLTDEIRGEWGHPAFYEESGKLFKVFIGYFNTEDEARRILESVRARGYPDAWLVY